MANPKPTDLPRWSDVGGDIVEPTSGKKDVGWVSAERPPAQYFNWLLNQGYKWLKWLDDNADIILRTLSVNRPDDTDSSPVVRFTDQDNRGRIYVGPNGHFGGPVIWEHYRWGPGGLSFTGGSTRDAVAPGMEVSHEVNNAAAVIRGGSYSNQPFPSLRLNVGDAASDDSVNLHTAGDAGVGNDTIISDFDNVVAVMEWQALMTVIGTNEVEIAMGFHDGVQATTPQATFLATTTRHVMFTKDSANTNWQTRVADGAGGTSNDSGTPPVASAWQTFRLEFHGVNTPVGVNNGFATARFFIDGVKEDEIADANVPNSTGVLGVCFRNYATTTGPGAGGVLLEISPVRVSWNLRLAANEPA